MFVCGCRGQKVCVFVYVCGCRAQRSVIVRGCRGQKVCVEADEVLEALTVDGLQLKQVQVPGGAGQQLGAGGTGGDGWAAAWGLGAAVGLLPGGWGQG